MHGRKIRYLRVRSRDTGRSFLVGGWGKLGADKNDTPMPA